MSKVIVVGGGLSGLSAAHTLYDRGANVLVLDKNPLYVTRCSSTAISISYSQTHSSLGSY